MTVILLFTSIIAFAMSLKREYRDHQCPHGWDAVCDFTMAFALLSIHAWPFLQGIFLTLGAMNAVRWWHHRGKRNKAIEKVRGIVTDIGHRLVVKPLPA